MKPVPGAENVGDHSYKGKTGSVKREREEDKNRNLENVFICSINLFIWRLFIEQPTMCQTLF